MSALHSPVMSRAVELARRGRFHTAPNPCVGAVLTAGASLIVAEGWHTACGQPHAEVEAIQAARDKHINPAGCTLWVTLEPCNHHGKTPPCTQAILDASIKRVMVGLHDPNADVAGGGVEFLRQNGVEVQTGWNEQECSDLLADFVAWKQHKRSYCLLKLASTLDGRIAARTGHSKWVTGKPARQRVHQLRQGCSAVIVGGNTFYEDDPDLTCRLIEQKENVQGNQPLAVVVTTRLPEPEHVCKLTTQRPGQTIFWTTDKMAGSELAQTLITQGVRIWALPMTVRGLDINYGLRRLYDECAVHYALCEGGGKLGLSLLQAGLADEFLLFLAPKVLGDSAARPLFAGRSPETMTEALQLRRIGCEPVGEDVLMTFRPDSNANDEGRE